MAERPIFIPAPQSPVLVEEVFLQLRWNSGFALVQKEKNIRALHDAARAKGIGEVLEVSSKSSEEIGRKLSAFNLKVRRESFDKLPLEVVFQGSKVFTGGGPYRDLYDKEPRDAKKDSRLKESGSLTAFDFDQFCWPLEPKTAFYDWLYLGCLYPLRERAPEKLFKYAAFSDIEFNPTRSINCQARSVALFVSLLKRNLLDEAMRSPTSFLAVLNNSAYRPQLHSDSTSRDLFPHRH